MRKDANDGAEQPDRAFTAAFALLVTALACSIVAISAAREVPPVRLPALRLSSSSVQAQRESDLALAARAQSFMRDGDVTQLLDLYYEEGLAELESALDVQLLQAQRKERGALAKRVFARLGEAGTRAFSARVTEDAMSALMNDRESDLARGLLGSFPELLARYGYVDARGRLLAPELSLRALYKARFNLIFERPTTFDFSRIELQAYEGFSALQNGGLPPQRRAEAAASFYRAGGTDAAEALAIWLFQGDERKAARDLFVREYQRTGALRLRNMALFTRDPAEL